MVKKQKLKILIIPLYILAVAGSVILLLEITDVTNFYTRNKDSLQKEDNSISYEPPTKEEQQAGDIQKEQNEADSSSSQQKNNDSNKSVSVIVTDAGQYDDSIEVRSFIPDYYRDGTCTITFTKDSYRVTKDTPAYRDVSTTICTNPLFARSEFAAGGSWQVIVSYTSDDGVKGQSSSQMITIK